MHDKRLHYDFILHSNKKSKPLHAHNPKLFLSMQVNAKLKIAPNRWKDTACCVKDIYVICELPHLFVIGPWL